MFNDFKKVYKREMKTKETRKKKVIQTLILVPSVFLFFLFGQALCSRESSLEKTIALFVSSLALLMLEIILEVFVWTPKKSIEEKRKEHLKKTWTALCICDLKSKEEMELIEKRCNEEIAKQNGIDTLLAIFGVFISLIVAGIEGLDSYTRIVIIAIFCAIIIAAICFKSMISSFFTIDLTAMRDDVCLTRIEKFPEKK